MNIEKNLKIAAETLLGIIVLVMILTAIRLISLGNRTGMQLLVSSPLILTFIWLGWIQPKITGAGLICLGLFVIAVFGNLPPDPGSWRLLGSPFLVAGLLFLGAGWEFQRVH